MFSPFIVITQLTLFFISSHKDLEIESTIEDCLTCHVLVLDVQLVGNEDGEMIQCITEDDMTYEIKLPSTFMDTHRHQIEEGSFYICVPDGVILDNGDKMPKVNIPDASQIKIVDEFPSGNRRELAVTGTHDVLIVRISTPYGEYPSVSSNDLAGSVLGIGNNPIENNMAAQYRRCSINQIDFQAAQGLPGITNGVLEVTVNQRLADQSTTGLINTLISATKSTLGVSSIPYRHTMYCLPYGTVFGSKDWVAFAYIGGTSSFYNNEWCDRLSSQMHEIGHNLGFHHSSENGVQYQDQTGVVSIADGSSSQTVPPEKTANKLFTHLNLFVMNAII